MSFGYILKKFRKERGLSLRELGKLCGLDHAYIHRLEKDEKTAPSEKTVDTLARKLKLDARRTHMFTFLVGKNVDQLLIDLILEDADQPLDVFEAVSQMSYRGKRPSTRDEWLTKIDQVKELLNS